MSKIAQILLPKEIDLKIDINKSIIYLNHTKLCDYSGECCYKSDCYQEFENYLKSVNYTGLVRHTYVDGGGKSWHTYTNGTCTEYASIDRRLVMTFF